ncbi:MAG TPA: gluconate 2-dehydrogenase subunit 3 family protein [Chitinophagaceae bacterium]|nr:gluconate 2-dehydrogenase subunit 3 family protein [Chitinophagaceae bacterium]
MDRREIIKLITLLTGGAMVGGQAFLSGCNAGGKADVGFTAANLALLDEVGETIIPATDTPGAKAAKVSEYMKVIVTDCYTEAEQQAFYTGIGQLEEACKKMHGKSFMNCTPEQRHSLLTSLESEAKDFNKIQYDNDTPSREKAIQQGRPYEFAATPKHYYTMMKQLSIAGYFTSEIGSKQALRFVPVPGKYDGAYPYKKGERAFHE